MELPSDVLIHNELLGLKGGRGSLIRVSSEGYFEVNLAFGQNQHRVLLPISSTVVIHQQPEDDVTADFDIER